MPLSYFSYFLSVPGIPEMFFLTMSEETISHESSSDSNSAIVDFPEPIIPNVTIIAGLEPKSAYFKACLKYEPAFL